MQVDLDALPRKERERLNRRREMLGAARAVFAERGYEQATLDEVAERAEYGKGTLYNYFPGGKEAILMAVFDEMFDEFVDLVDKHFRKAPDPPDAASFRALIEVMIRNFVTEPAHFLVFTKEVHRLMLGDHQELAAALVAHRDRVIGALSNPIARAVEAGVLKPHPPEAVAHMLLGNVVGYLNAVLTCESVDGRPAGLPDPAEASALIGDILFEGLLQRSNEDTSQS